MFDLLQLKSFCAVVDTQSFTKAGRKVHRTQSTVSAQIANLEEMYGEKLLERFHEGVQPTESGQILYTFACQIIALADESLEKISELKQGLKGDLIIGASTIPASYILPQLIGTFIQKNPEVHVSIETSNSKNVINSVLSRTIEIGAVGQKIKNSRLEYIKLATDNIVLVVPAGHPWSKKQSISLHDLSREPYISREEGSGSHAAVEAGLRKHGIKQFNTSIRVGSTEAVKQSIKAGLGVSFISEWALKDDPLPAVSVKNLDISRTFYIVFLKTSAKKRIIQAFTDFVKGKETTKRTTKTLRHGEKVIFNRRKKKNTSHRAH